MSWREYWESDSSVYVSERHRLVHYELLAGQLRELVRGPGQRVLDYGCGEALVAGRLAEACGTLLLLDAAQSVRTRVAERFAGEKRIRVLGPEDLEREPDGSLDLVILNSVLQYVPRDEAEALLRKLAAKLAPGGELVVGDVIPPSVGPVQDAAALMSFARDNGFLAEAVAGLAKAAVSGYGAKRSKLGLTHYDAPEMIAMLGRAGLSAERMPQNLGHNQARMAFVGRKSARSMESD